METAEKIKSRLEGLPAAEALRRLSDEFGEKAVFSTSFGLEDQVIAHLIFGQQLAIEVFTLDTGRLFAETYSVWNKTLAKYQQPIRALHPDAEALNRMVSEKGPNSFYRDIESRQECCRIRKSEPLKKALEGKSIWITGIRREQSDNRSGMDWVEWDGAHQVWKIHPLFFWETGTVEKFIKDNQIPYNRLHDKGFPSIGCAPCTRAVAPGAHPRSGRWWWEDAGKKECGLHLTQNT